MTNEKFTPGPWEVVRHFNADRVTLNEALHIEARTDDGGSRAIGRLYPDQPADAELRPVDVETEANARLIAAAPALFEALARLRTIGARISVHKHAGLTVTNEDWSEMHEALNTARAALSAARGES